MLICPVRDCHLPLTREAQRVVCARSHSFDIARSGYINLLGPQDRRSKNPGDNSDVVAARRRLHDLGVTRPLLEGVHHMLGLTPHDSVLEVGCGDGFFAGQLAEQTGCRATGIDISTAAIDAAAKRYPKCQWLVANADRFIPCEDASFNVVLSVAARRNPAEFHRVLCPDGRLLMGVPAPDDLEELRGTGRDRATQVIEEFRKTFSVTDQDRVTTHADLDEPAVRDVMLSIYRPLGDPAKAMRLTFSLDLLVFIRTQESN